MSATKTVLKNIVMENQESLIDERKNEIFKEFRTDFEVEVCKLERRVRLAELVCFEVTGNETISDSNLSVDYDLLFDVINDLQNNVSDFKKLLNSLF